MSTHTRTDIEATDDYECAMGDCGHDGQWLLPSRWHSVRSIRRVRLHARCGPEPRAVEQSASRPMNGTARSSPTVSPLRSSTSRG